MNTYNHKTKTNINIHTTWKSTFPNSPSWIKGYEFMVVSWLKVYSMPNCFFFFNSFMQPVQRAPHSDWHEGGLGQQSMARYVSTSLLKCRSVGHSLQGCLHFCPQVLASPICCAFGGGNVPSHHYQHIRKHTCLCAVAQMCPHQT